jgi:hypothetical protein
MLTKTESPIGHAHDILALLDAILVPKEVLVIHSTSHQKGEDKIAKGNKAASSHAGIYSWSSPLEGDSLFPRETTILIRGK